MFRVIRFLKELTRWKILIGVLDAFVEGGKCFLYILPMWFLFIYIFGTVGCQFLRSRDPDRFDNWGTAFYTLFQCSTKDGLDQVMYTSIYGCTLFPSGHTPTKCVDSVSVPDEATNALFPIIFFVVYILMTDSILLSAVLGVVQMTMDKAMVREEREKRIKQGLLRFRQVHARDDEAGQQIDLLSDCFDKLDSDRSGDITQEEVQVCKLSSLASTQGHIRYRSYRGSASRDAGGSSHLSLRQLIEDESWSRCLHQIIILIQQSGDGRLTKDLFVQALFEPTESWRLAEINRQSRAHDLKRNFGRKGLDWVRRVYAGWAGVLGIESRDEHLQRNQNMSRQFPAVLGPFSLQPTSLSVALSGADQYTVVGSDRSSADLGLPPIVTEHGAALTGALSRPSSLTFVDRREQQRMSIPSEAKTYRWMYPMDRVHLMSDAQKIEVAAQSPAASALVSATCRCSAALRVF
jgi:hypothetical protein